MDIAIRRRFPSVGQAASFAAAVALTAAVIVLLSDQSAVWAAVIALMLAFGAAMFWSGAPKKALFHAFLITLPVDISKALIVPVGEIYTPGLYASVSDVIFFAYAALWFSEKILARQRLARLDAITKLAIVFTLYMWVSALVADDSFAGALVAITHTKHLLIFVIIADTIRSDRHIKEVMLALSAGLALQLAMVAAQQTTGVYIELAGAKMANPGNLVFIGEGGLHTFRPTGFLNHPIMLAGYLVLLLLPLFALVLAGRRRLGRAWAVSVLLFFGAACALILTLARSGWVAFGIAVLCFLSLGFMKGLVSRQQIIGMTLLAAIALAAISIAYPPAILRLTESDQRSSEGRLLMIDQASLIVTRNPVIGVGLGGYNKAARSNIPESFSHVGKDFQEALMKLGVVHNKYLLLAAETGIVGLVLFLLLLWKAIALFFSVRQWRDKVSAALGLGLACGLIGEAILYLFDHFYIDPGVELFWAFCGFLLALVRVQDVRGAKLAEQRP